MAEEIDDNEFYQQDFTTASEWEIFNARLEEVFHEWKLPFTEIGKPLDANQLFRADWDMKSEVIYFADVELEVKRYRAVIPSPIVDEEITIKNKPCQAHLDLISLENNFNIQDPIAGKIHPLAAWYGLREFVVIEPTGQPITNESQFRVLLSSACITVAESNTEVPVFVHVMPHDLHVYLGVCESPSLRTNFNIVALEQIPPTCKYLSGLLCMFKGKIGVHYVDPVTVSVRFSYSLTDFVNADYCPERRSPFSNDSEEDLDENPIEIPPQSYVLPYGVTFDPVNEIILHCTWPRISENVIVDSPTYSDLDPLQAPIWSIRANFRHQLIYYLTESCSDYLKLCENTRTLSSIVGSSYDFNQYLEGGNPLDLLTESKIPSISSVISGGRSRKGSSDPKHAKTSKSEGPLNEEELMQMLYYMFPDAQSNASHPYSFGTEEFDPLKIKSALPDSLVFRLSMLLAICNSEFGGISAVAHLWAEFTQEMRYRVERCIQIPGVASGFPDSRTSLLHQKLQMLNVCMERRRIREGGLPFSMTPLKASKSQKDDSEEEQFYDCSTDEEHDTVHPAWNKPEGRLSRLGTLTLIDSAEPLYIPITQEPVPKTEDQLEDDAEVMLKLGPGSELCAQMMSASLLSDMESFKAANPNGKLEDFIRWYSPRDWIEEADAETGDEKGRLSQRMLIPGNTWQTVWKTAKPVPARRQKRLFDDTKEAEKALHYFETRTIGQICQLTIAPLFHATVLKVNDEIEKTDFAEPLRESFERVVMILCKLSRETWSQTNTTANPLQIASQKKWEALLQDISQIEHMNIQSMSIVRKLFGNANEKLDAKQIDIVMSLLKGLEAQLEGAGRNPISLQLLNMFGDAKISKNEFALEVDSNTLLGLPDPIKKEYTLRVSGKTVDKGMGGPQFLRAILDKNLRLCGAFTDNTTFL